MAIFTKLFDTRMVASNCCGLSMSLTAILSVLDLLSFNFNKSEGLSAKNATSDPEIRAEQNNKTIVSANPMDEAKLN